MEKTSNDRVIELLKTLKIDEVEAAQRVGKHASSIYRITNKSNEPTKSTLKQIADALGANYEWLLTGNGDMLASKSMTAMIGGNPWENALVSQLTNENSRLQKEVERLWGILANYLPAKQAANFNKALKEAAVYSLIKRGTALGAAA